MLSIVEVKATATDGLRGQAGCPKAGITEPKPLIQAKKALEINANCMIFIAYFLDMGG